MTARTGQIRQDNLDGTTTVVERGYLDRTPSQDRATGMEQPRQFREHILDMTSESGPLGQDSWDRTSGTGQSGQDSRDKTVSAGQPHRQPGQISLERTEMTGLSGPDSLTVVSGVFPITLEGGHGR
jgi:hypothetical protein